MNTNFISEAPRIPAEMYKLLVGVSAPRPIAWISTLNEDGSDNLAPFSFSMVASVTPPVIVFCPLTSKDPNKPTKDSLRNCMRTGEFVYHAVTKKTADITNKTSVDLPYGKSEVDYIGGIKMIASDLVKPRRIEMSPVHFECVLAKPLQGEAIISFGDAPLAGNLVFGEIVRVHIEQIFLKQDGSIDYEKLELVGRMDGSFWNECIRFDMPSERQVKNNV